MLTWSKYFDMFMLNRAGRIVCSTASGGYAFSSIAMGRVIQAGQVSAEEPDRVS